jgi:CheY-like chemotaxis protein
MTHMDPILIIEDDEDVRDSLNELLTLRGYRVFGAANGREALDRLESGLSPCLIILDLMLPIMNGWDFRQRQLADSRWRHIPTIVLSGVNDLALESQRLQAVGFLSKPINFNSLFETVDRYC